MNDRPSPRGRRAMRAASTLSLRIAAPAALVLIAACATGTPVASEPVPAPDGESRTALLWVNGMGCPLCSNNVDQQLRQVRGVEAVRINLGTGVVSADLAALDPPTERQLASAIDRTGFTLVRIQMPATGGGR